MLKTLVIGYGNPNREDDGVAWHILEKIAARYKCPITSVEDLDPLQTQEEDQNVQILSPPRVSPRFALPPRLTASARLAFALQLTPEMAETVSRYERVCFVDAHTGAYPEEVRLTHLTPSYQASPFTHHLTPESCLVLAKTLYGHAPEGLLVSVRGYRFGYGTGLSDQTAALVCAAAEEIIKWIVSTI
jgi:Ni,Fe-hydrogenase maturation factor